ncbi:hypothetical protein SAMN02745866_02491 [Alteromonadaceae bacterium Bs31]|nr:hypothetical protein SAMN02745866_02491 [Alteromonadaceae bacterium Bs31]
MHTSFDKNESYTQYSPARSLPTDIYQSVSDWFEIRVTEMAGYDYIFAPMDMCDQITDFVTLQEFLINIQVMLGSELDRTILVGVENREHGTLEMDRYDVSWQGGIVKDCHRTSLEGSPQFDFISMLHDYSSPLISE